MKRLSELATIIKMNEAESAELWHLAHSDTPYSTEEFCRFWASTQDCELVCITRDSEGCAVWYCNVLQFFPGFRVSVADTVGAGDAFAAAFLHGLDQNWPLEKTSLFDNRIGGLVASRAGAIPEWSLDECSDLAILP